MKKLCSKCNIIIQDKKTNFCPTCGTELSEIIINEPKPNKKNTGFISAIKTCYKNSFIFKGRAKISEFWWFWLYGLILNLLIGFIIGFFFPNINPKSFRGTIAFIDLFILDIPYLSVWCRRLHDIGISARWLLFSFLLIFIPLILLTILQFINIQNNEWLIFVFSAPIIIGGFAILILWGMCSRAGQKGENKYGPDPEKN